MAKIKMSAEVVSQQMLGPGIFSMWIRADEIAGQARAGQFVSLYTKDASRLLPRPISICEIDRQNRRLRLVYRVAGAGTKEFSGCREGGSVEVLGPLGNGFPKVEPDKSVLLAGGGIGIPPLLELARELECRKTAVLGYRDSLLFLKDEFELYADTAVATEDGSAGTRGNVLDAIREKGLEADVIMACGPAPMLRALKAYAAERRIRCWISLEERMACGIGACLACVCRSRDEDEHSRVHNKRICKDGPVFEAGEVEL